MGVSRLPVGGRKGAGLASVMTFQERLETGIIFCMHCDGNWDRNLDLMTYPLLGVRDTVERETRECESDGGDRQESRALLISE